MATEYRFRGFVIDQDRDPHGRSVGPDHIAVALSVGKNAKRVLIRITDEEATEAVESLGKAMKLRFVRARNSAAYQDGNR